jgi:prepilin-type N-terminal cleavage/methylation domain-containing protein
MKGRHSIFAKQKGMTLVEVLVTLGILSFVLGATLTLYSSTFRNIRTHDSFLNILHDADVITSYIGADIRRAHEFLKDYQTSQGQTVVAAMKVAKGIPEGNEESVIVYSLDAEHPNRLVRSVHTGASSTSIELSTLIREFKVIEDEVAGNVNTFQASSAFALRY